jgi:hypothetical protein
MAPTIPSGGDQRTIGGRCAELKRNDLLVLVGVWCLLNATGAFVVLAALAAFAYPPALDLSGAARVGALFGLSVVTILGLVYFSVAMVAGVGVLTRKECGRVAALVLAAFSLPRIPLGSLVGFLVLIYLTRPRVKAQFQTAGQ